MGNHSLRLGVVGAGATGGYLAAVLAREGHDVTLLARPGSAGAVRRDGIQVTDADGTDFTAHPTRVVVNGDDIEPVDVTLFCVKTYDTEQAAKDIAPLIGERGTVLCLQNGVANEDVLAEMYGPERVLSGVLYIGSERVSPAVIRASTQARVIFGPYDRNNVGEEAARHSAQLLEVLEAAPIEVAVDDDIRAAKWQKFLFNCGLNPLTALTAKTLGRIRAVPAGDSLFSALVNEAAVTARGSGAPLPDDALESVMATADKMDISSSMAEDLSAGRAMELGAFTGHVLHLAETHGLEAPTTRVVHQLLQVLEGERVR